MLDDPFAVLAGPLAGTSRLPLEVVGAEPLTPHMRRLQLTAPQLASFSYAPGQDLMLLVGVDGNRPVRRRYTIRALDRASSAVTLDIVLHGDGPGERWVRAARQGDKTAQHNLGVYYATLEAAERASAAGEAPAQAAGEAEVNP